MNESASDDEALRKVLEDVAFTATFAGVNVKSVHTRNGLGEIPLHVAAVWGDLVAMELLINAGSEINVAGEYGYTPLHEAASQGHMDAVRYLIKKGADITVKNDDGRTPVDILIARGLSL